MPRATPAAPVPVRVLVAVASVVTAGSFPVFLVGGLGVQLREDLGFGPALLGAAAAGFFGVAALASRAMGWVAERLGATRGMRLAALVSSLCLVLLAFSTGPVWLLAVVCLAGVPNALGQPSSNLLITQSVPPRRRGFGFGVKHSAIPAATMLAGAAVPGVALTIGWRWVFVMAGGIALLAAASVPRGEHRRWPERGPERSEAVRNEKTTLLLLAVAGALGSAAANALGAYVTTTAVAVGFSPAAAGLVLSAGSLAGLLMRLASGLVADRWNPDLMRVITVMLLLGAVGYGLLAVDSPIAVLTGVLVAFGGGWAWSGLLNFAVAKLIPHRVASATSSSQTGIFVGGSLGPLLFGLLAEHVGLPGAWTAAGGAAVLAGVLMALVRRQNQRSG